MNEFSDECLLTFLQNQGQLFCRAGGGDCGGGGSLPGGLHGSCSGLY